MEETMQNDQGQTDGQDSFSNIWNCLQKTLTKPQTTTDITVSEPLFSFSESEGPLENQLSLEVISTKDIDFDCFGSSPQQSQSITSLVNTGNDGKNENSYPCSSAYGSGPVMRTYSGEIPQHNNATTLPSLVVSSSQQPGLVHQQNHTMVYQSASPHNGEGPNSTHSSPYAASPNGGYEYPTSPPSSKPSIPSNTDYPGDYNFQINFGELTMSAPKSAQYTYSHTLNKLFVKMNVTCPIRFKCDRPAPINSIIRAVPVFKRPEHVTDVATRCPNHKIPDEVNYNLQSSHLIRAEMPNDSQVRYEVGQDSRESVSVFYERPQIGAEFTTILYKFMCLSSCVGGINRRPLLTVFTLECEGQVIGRRVVEVRICSCPGRDRSQEEKKQRHSSPHNHPLSNDNNAKRPYKNVQASIDIVQSKKRKTPNGADQEEFILKVRGREKYEMLRRVKEAFDLMELVGGDQISAYRRKEEEDSTKQSSSQTTNQAHANQAGCSSQSASTSAPSQSTVAEPTASINNSQGFSLTPKHSSHPLTATPTGEPPASEPFEYGYNGQARAYWSEQLGQDVPDGSDTQPILEREATVPILSSEVSAIKQLSSQSSQMSTASSRYGSQLGSRQTTRVTLRQTISLNRDAVKDLVESGKLPDWSKPVATTEPELRKLVSSGEGSWMARIKTEQSEDELTTLSQQMEADAAKLHDYMGQDD